MAVPDELSADCCGSGEGFLLSTGGPVARSNAGAVASAALNTPGSLVASPSMSIPGRKIVPTSRLLCRNQSLVLPHTPSRSMILAVMTSESLSSPQLTVSSNVPLLRFPVSSSTASVSPSQSSTRIKAVWGSRPSAKLTAAKADRSQHGDVDPRSADQLSRQPAPPLTTFLTSTLASRDLCRCGTRGQRCDRRGPSGPAPRSRRGQPAPGSFRTHYRGSRHRSRQERPESRGMRCPAGVPQQQDGRARDQGPPASGRGRCG